MIRPWRFIHFSALRVCFLILARHSATCQDWTTYRPSLQSQVARLELTRAKSLLSNFCVSLIDTKPLGPTCEIRKLGPSFAEITDLFYPQGVIFGHFLDSSSEEAAISGWSGFDTHPSHWGGTLLMTRRDGGWRQLWYKSGVITRSCEKAERPDGREILICEFEDGGMGHRYHVLNAIDLRHASAGTSPIVSADSFDSDFCRMQRQTMEAVRWDTDRQSFSVAVRTPKWQVLPEGACGPSPEAPKTIGAILNLKSQMRVCTHDDSVVQRLESQQSQPLNMRKVFAVVRREWRVKP